MIWPVWSLLPCSMSANMASNLDQSALLLVMVSSWSPPLPLPSSLLRRRGGRSREILSGLSDLVRVGGVGVGGARHSGGRFGGGAISGSLARTGSLATVVENMVPLVWAATSIPSSWPFLVSSFLCLATSGPSTICWVTLVFGSTFSPGTPNPSFLPLARPGQASGGSLDCQSRPWPASLEQEQVALGGISLVE